MATNIFVFWSDGLGGRKFDNNSGNWGQSIRRQKLLAGPTVDQFFSITLGLPEGLMLVTGIDWHINRCWLEML